MNSEPVAWINRADGNSFVDWDKDPYSQEHIPLYTHPAKTLTDEEIEEVFYSLEYGHSANDFARAILLKAQENG